MSFRRLLLGLLLCVTSCASGPTPVSQGQLYQPGVPEYDAFFVRLHDLQETVLGAPAERENPRKALASELGLEPKASVELIVKQLAKRIAEVRKHGSTLSIKLIGLDEGAEESDAVVSSINPAGNAETTPFTRALDQSAKQAVKLAVKLRSARRDAERLQAGVSRLESDLDARFKLLGPARANDARRNLVDARTRLPTLARGVESVERDNKELVDLLAKAAPPVEEKQKATKHPRHGGKPAGRKPKPETDDFQP